MKKYFVRILYFILVMTSTLHVSGKEKDEIKDSDLIAKSAVIIDGKTGRVLYGKNYEQKRAMASTTKIMTCIIALENCRMDQVVEVSGEAASMPKVHMNLKKGEKYYMKEQLYAIMLQSYNDVAVAVAEGVAGSVEGFAKLMNQKAKKIGAVHTNFVTPNGLDAENHYSTAYDMALIGAYAIQNNQFLEITNTKSYDLTDVENKRNIHVINRDAFLTMDQSAVGIKTGFTGEAGYCFVGAVKNQGRIFVSCVLACGWPPNKSYKWKDTLCLMNYGKENYHYKNLLEKNKTIRIKTEGGTKKSIQASVVGNSKYLMNKNDNSDFKTNLHYEYPIKKNQKIGTVDVYINHQKVQTRNIVAKESVEEFNFQYCLNKVFNWFILQ